MIAQIARTHLVELAVECNSHIVEPAVKYVYGTDDRQLRFVQNRFGRTPQPRLIADMVAKSEKGEKPS